MRLGGHQTFHLRESWLYKGLTALSLDALALSHDGAAERLGVGKNMAEAIAYWIQACQLATRGEGLELTPIARTILRHDPYLELDGTLLLIQYLLASNEDYATAWYWFFNKLGVNEFDAETLHIYLASFVEKSGGRRVPPNTVHREVSCLLATYRQPEYRGKDTPETINPSPFARFGLLKALPDGRYQKRPIEMVQIAPQVYAYLLYRYWHDILLKPSTLTFDNITKGAKSPSLALGLNEEQTAHMLDTISKSPKRGYLSFSRSGGYSVVTIDGQASSRALDDYYAQSKTLLGGR